MRGACHSCGCAVTAPVLHRTAAEPWPAGSCLHVDASLSLSALVADLAARLAPPAYCAVGAEPSDTVGALLKKAMVME